MMKVFGVSVLIYRTGLVLAIARRNNHNDWGLPGGRVEVNETPSEAAIREFKEETGYYLINPIRIFTRNCGSDLAETYAGNIIGDIMDEQGFPLCFPLTNQKGEPPLAWKSPKEIVDSPTFGEYNLNLFNYVGIKIN